jgi:hypothetical protein
MFAAGAPGGFGPLPLAPELLAVLKEHARYRAVLRVVTGEGASVAFTEVVQAAERTLQLDSAHARERAAWSSASGSARADEVPADAYPARAERDRGEALVMTPGDSVATMRSLDRWWRGVGARCAP